VSRTDSTSCWPTAARYRPSPATSSKWVSFRFASPRGRSRSAGARLLFTVLNETILVRLAKAFPSPVSQSEHVQKVLRAHVPETGSMRPEGSSAESARFRCSYTGWVRRTDQVANVVVGRAGPIVRDIVEHRLGDLSEFVAAIRGQLSKDLLKASRFRILSGGGAPPRRAQ
jgi:hypothetical protein